MLYIEPPDSPYATVAEITTVPADGSNYLTGETITATVTFSEAVTVNGSPRLPLGIGSNTRHAGYTGIDTAGMVLSFSYTVVDGDQDLDGLTIDKFALELNGATITGTTGANAGVDAALTHTGVAAHEDHRVNLPPLITGVEVTSTPKAANDTYGLGEDIEITVTFSEAVNVTGDVDFGLSVSGWGGRRWPAATALPSWCSPTPCRPPTTTTTASGSAITPTPPTRPSTSRPASPSWAPSRASTPCWSTTSWKRWKTTRWTAA